MVITGTKRGQATLVNVIALLVVMFVALVFLPILNSMSDTAATALLASPNDMTPYVVMLIRLLPVAILVSIILTGVYYAIPRPQGG